MGIHICTVGLGRPAAGKEQADFEGGRGGEEDAEEAEQASIQKDSKTRLVLENVNALVLQLPCYCCNEGHNAGTTGSQPTHNSTSPQLNDAISHQDTSMQDLKP
jgi:hypothetical protein